MPSPRSIIKSASVSNLLPLGYKDYSEQPFTAATYEWSKLPSIGTTAGGQKLFLGGFSGLAFEGADGRRQAEVHHAHRSRSERRADRRHPSVPAAGLHAAPGAFHARSGHRRVRPAAADPAETGQWQAAHGPAEHRAVERHQPAVQRRSRCGSVRSADRARSAGRRPRRHRHRRRRLVLDGDEYRPAIYHFSSTGKLIERLIPIGTHAAAGASRYRRRAGGRVRRRSAAGGDRPASPESRHGSAWRFRTARSTRSCRARSATP